MFDSKALADKLIFRDNATILFKDGKRYVAKCCEGDKYDKEKGLLVCLAKAHGYTFNDLQEMLKGAEVQGEKQKLKYPYNVPKEIIIKALKIIGKNGIGFDSKAEVKEFYKLIKDKFNIGFFNGDFSPYPRYFFIDGSHWGNGFNCAYSYKRLKTEILKLLRER